MAHRYNNDVKHIKILAKEGCFHITENRKFRSILVSADFNDSYTDVKNYFIMYSIRNP